MNDQYALISRDDRFLSCVEAANVCDAFDKFVEMFGEFPDGAIMISMTRLIEAIW